jgi:hypothetical protein
MTKAAAAGSFPAAAAFVLSRATRRVFAPCVCAAKPAAC